MVTSNVAVRQELDKGRREGERDMGDGGTKGQREEGRRRGREGEMNGGGDGVPLG